MLHLIYLSGFVILWFPLLISLSNCEVILKSNMVTISFDEPTKALTVECKSGFLDINITNLPSPKLHNIHKFENRNCVLINSIRRIYSNWNITGTKILDLSGISKAPIILRKEQFDNEAILDVEELNLNYSFIARIEDFTFHKFRNLKKLHLIGNFLEELPRHFSISPIVEVNMGYNSLKYLDEIRLKNFVELEKIDLRRSGLPTFSDTLFHPLRSIKIAILSHNFFENLPQRAFASNRNLTQISIENGRLRNIELDAFLGLAKLEKLNLKNNNLTALLNDSFIDLTSLKELDLSRNRLEILPENLFRNLRSLRVLLINENVLTDLSKAFSQKLESLIELNLAHNKLTKIFDDTFAGITKVEKLILKGNHIFRIDNQAFAGLKSLNTLELGYNNLSNPEDTSSFIDGLNRVENLYLDGNNFTSIPKNISSKVDVVLSLRHNKVSFLDVKDLLPIIDTNLEGNNVTMIKLHEVEPKEEGSDIAINPGTTLTCDCGAYNLIKYLDYKYSNHIRGGVYFSNIICAKPDRLKGKSPGDIKSKDFTCDSTDLYTCPAECECKLSPERKTLIIDCSRKKLTIPPVLQPFTAKMYINEDVGVMFEVERADIHLEDNALTEFSSENLHYDNVSGLFLSNNDLSVIQWLPTNLEVLKLDLNKLTSLKEAITLIIKNSRSLKQITLSGNLWKCNCKWINFINEIKDKIEILDYDHILCSNGSYLKDYPLCRKKIYDRRNI